MKRTEPNIETLKTLLKLKNEGSTVQEICEKLNHLKVYLPWFNKTDRLRDDGSRSLKQ